MVRVEHPLAGRRHALERYLADDGEEGRRVRRPQPVVALPTAVPALRRHLARGGHVVEGGLVAKHGGVRVLQQHLEQEHVRRVGAR